MFHLCKIEDWQGDQDGRILAGREGKIGKVEISEKNGNYMEYYYRTLFYQLGMHYRDIIK